MTLGLYNIDITELILLIDNFDSFTFNLVDYFGRLGLACDVVRNCTDPSGIDIGAYQGMVLSPGPGTPANAGYLGKYINMFHKKLPVLGVCLGHQAVGEFFGGELGKAEKPMHGKISRIDCQDAEMFANIPETINIVRYHSLIMQKLPTSLVATAHTATGEIMAMRHQYLPIWGLQFHPEAILSEYGLQMLANWWSMAKTYSKPTVYIKHND